jgi:hypothetical protein
VNEAEEIEELDAQAEEVRITRLAPAPGSLPVARQESALPVRAAAAAAAGGFMAGAAVVGIVSRRHKRSTAIATGRRPRRLVRRRPGRKSIAPAPPLKVVGSRSFMVDVHLLGRPGPDR